MPKAVRPNKKQKDWVKSHYRPIQDDYDTYRNICDGEKWAFNTILTALVGQYVNGEFDVCRKEKIQDTSPKESNTKPKMGRPKKNILRTKNPIPLLLDSDTHNSFIEKLSKQDVAMNTILDALIRVFIQMNDPILKIHAKDGSKLKLEI